jgi:nicotinamidase/pyrazinamidase
MDALGFAESALVAVDLQRGFTALCPQELPVPGGLEIVGKVNCLLALPWGRIDASTDWHPPDHCSFFGRRDNLYPPHCVAGTPGAEFLPGLHAERFHVIWRKGYGRDVETYAVTAQHPGFPTLLREQGIRQVILCGIATNICCFLTARDLRRAGFRTSIVEDASAGLDVPAANLFQEQARAEGLRLGIDYVTTDEVLAAGKPV